MAEFRIRRADIVALQPCANPNVNMIANDPNGPGYGLIPIELFDKRVKEQGLDPEDLVFPDGWTELHSIFLYQRQPKIHKWLMDHGLIPRDDVASRFPVDFFYKLYGDFPKSPQAQAPVQPAKPMFQAKPMPEAKPMAPVPQTKPVKPKARAQPKAKGSKP
jgi:hypothetical protein